ncbi:hypothetical protein ACJBU6_05600 [Exserohilum turcicum]
MALRIPALRHALRQPLLSPRATQRRWAQVQDVRFLVTHKTEERVLAKYREKLESKAREKGLRGLDELKEQYKDKIVELRRQAIVPGATGPLTPPAPAPGQQKQQKQQKQTPTPDSPPPPPGVQTLSSFLDLAKAQDLSASDIEGLWRYRHGATPNGLHFVVPAATFSQLLHSAKQHPSFVLPVPRDMPAHTDTDTDTDTETDTHARHAAELHYLQFAHPHDHTTTLMFTTLAEFKLRGEFASPHTTVTFHHELARSHGLVLGQGLVVENRGVSVDDARWLVMCMQKFYVQTDEGKGRSELLSLFTAGDSAFEIQRLIDEAEKVL